MKIKLLFLFFVFTCQSFAQSGRFQVPRIEFNPRHYQCNWTDQKPTIDGNINDSSWMQAPWSEYFVDIEGPVQPEPYYQTRVKMLWDSEYLYFAAELHDKNIWARILQRDEVIFKDNDFEIFIDPDGDTHNYYELELNAYNTVWDLLLIKPYRDGNKVAVTDWDMKGLQTAVAIDGTINNPYDIDSNWTVEIAMPWKIFAELSETQLPPKDKDQWRINFSRVQWETEVIDGKYVKTKNSVTGKTMSEHNWVWSPQGIIAMHYPEMWGYVEFSSDVVGRLNKLFTRSDDEGIKWILREIYYKEKYHFINNHCYSSDIHSLGFDHRLLENTNYQPEIEVTSTSFLAHIKTDNKIFTIRDDGRIIINRTESK